MNKYKLIPWDEACALYDLGLREIACVVIPFGEECGKYADAEMLGRKWAQRKLNHTKYSAKKRGIEFSLTEKDFVFVDTCPVLGIPLAKVPNSSGGRDGAASVDRIDNSKGYTPDNIMVMSWRANRMKADATKEELIAMARWVLKTFTDGA